MTEKPERPGDSRKGTVRTRYDWSSTSPSTAIVEAVSAAVNREPTAVGPLYEAVDSDALDALVSTSGDGDSVAVSFVFAGCHVTVRGDGSIIVRADAPER